MIRQNKLKILVTTLITLFPVITGCIIWDMLPETLAVHFGSDNAANGWESKAFTVFGIPVILALLHLLCVFITASDPKQKNIGKKSVELMFWIVPAVSLLESSVIYVNALGVGVNVGFVCKIFMGILLIVIGNILPKAKQNYSFGLKLPWTLNDSENWNRTHRLAGWCMVIAGIVTLSSSFFNNSLILFTVIVLAVAVPVIYSFVYYKRNKRN